MAFGQPSGPPATAKQVNELLSLLQAAGHADFRDARGPMGFNQRQAGGKFTRDEAQTLIDQLTADAEAAEQGFTDTPPAPPTEPAPRARSAARAPASASALSTNEQMIRRIPTPQLAAELQRRGWIVVEP